MSLSRSQLKWLQTLDLSYSIKNYKRDFSNGFLIAEILSKYRPDIVEMHWFDIGISAKARTNNWEILDKILKKLKIPLTEKMLNDTSNSIVNGAPQILELIYNHIVKSKLVESPTLIENSQNTSKIDIIDNLPYKEDSISVFQDEANVGKVCISKNLVTFLKCDAHPHWFSRLSYQIILIRDCIIKRFESYSKKEMADLMFFFNEKGFEKTFLNDLKSALSSDITLFLDTILLIFSNIDVDSQLYQFSIKLLYKTAFFLHSLNLQTQIDPLKRLLNTKEIYGLLYKIFCSNESPSNWDFVNVIHAFVEEKKPIDRYEVSEDDRISGMLTFKSYFNSLSESGISMSGSKQTSLILFFVATIHCENPINLSNKIRLATFYLSESLTALNSNKRSFQFSSVASKVLIKNSFIDCAAAIHLISYLAYLEIQPLAVWTILNLEDEDSILKGVVFYIISLLSAKNNLPSLPISKLDNDIVEKCDILLLSCVRLTVNLLSNDSFENPNINELLNISVLLIYAAGLTDDTNVYEYVLYAYGPLLQKFPKLSANFVKGLFQTTQSSRFKVMNVPLKSTESCDFEINWGLPSIPSSEITKFTHLSSCWDIFCIAKGLIYVIVSNKSKKLSSQFFEVLVPLIKMYDLLSKELKVEEIEEWRSFLIIIEDLVLVSLTEKSSPNCVRFAIFVIKHIIENGGYAGSKNLHSIMMTILYIFRNSNSLQSRSMINEFICDMLDDRKAEPSLINDIQVNPVNLSSFKKQFKETFVQMSSIFPTTFTNTPEFAQFLPTSTKLQK